MDHVLASELNTCSKYSSFPFDIFQEKFVPSTSFPQSVVENSLYGRLGMEPSPNQFYDLSVDDVQKCDCWHHQFSVFACLFVSVQSVS